MHLLRPLLLDVNRWGSEYTVARLARDCAKWHMGDRSNFEGAVLAKDFYGELVSRKP